MPTIDEALQIGWKQHQSGDVRGAENIYRQVLLVAPSNENAWCFLGMACHDQGRYSEAVSAYQQAIAIKPRFPVALSNLGNTLKQLGRLEDAEASCREALRIKPDYSTAYNNLGVVLVAQGRLPEAGASFERALELMPNDAVAHANLGAALVRQGRFDEGTAKAQRALKINPLYAEAHKNQAIVALLMGDFEKGWPEYEWRWKCPGSGLPAIPQPRWSGEPLEGRTLLLHWEQGLGDTIQFVRYARRLKQQGARIVVCCQKPLFRLLGECEGIDTLVQQGELLPAFDLWTPMMSVPGILQTNLSSIPPDSGYLHADEKLSDYWKARLQEYPGYRIGIAWQGSPDFHADRQRSIPLRFFEALANVPDVRLFSLQKGLGGEQIKKLEKPFELIDFGEELDTANGPFRDTAAIMANLDLIITSDTSIPHLAGALGVPVWMALSVSPDWRWLLGREDSPWYPTMRIFRQQVLGDWGEVFRRIRRELMRHIQGAESAHEPSTIEPALQSAELPSPGTNTTTRTVVDDTPVLTAGFNSMVRARHGYMLFNRNDMYIGRSLQMYGEFSEDEIELMQRFLSAGDVVIEAGANIGTHTVAFANRVGNSGSVYAFEPQRIVFQTLCANMALNGLANAHCRQQAVGQSPGEIVVPPLDPNQVTNFGGLGLGTHQHGERVPVIPIDHLRLSNCRLIKIDVEGMEEAVLRGAQETIDRFQPALYVENDRLEQSPSLIAHIQSLGYRLYWHTPRLFRPANYFGNAENVFANIVSVNMLCLPPTMPTPVEGLRTIEGPNSQWNRS